MYRLLIFGGTTEGRELAVFCAENGIRADVSVATEYGAELLPEGVGKLTGRLGADGIAGLIAGGGYSAVADATHPYAREVTANIRTACEKTGTVLYRLIRSGCETVGESAASMEELIQKLNSCEGTVLSVLGSKSLTALTAVKGFRERVWLRLLPAEGITERCAQMGFDTGKVILDKGPFTAERNMEHIKLSGAEIMITKNSGAAGGYPEKAAAAEAMGIRLLTLAPPDESGVTKEELEAIIKRESESI